MYETRKDNDTLRLDLMVIVTAADPMEIAFADESWKHESAIIKLVGDFINSLPKE